MKPWPLSILSLILLISLSVYSLNNHRFYHPLIQDVNSFGKDYIGREIELRGNLKDSAGNDLYLSYSNEEVRVVGPDLEKATFGFTSALGTYENGYFKVKNIHNHNFNSIKYFTSLIGFMIFVSIFFKDWRLTKKGFKDARLD